MMQNKSNRIWNGIAALVALGVIALGIGVVPRAAEAGEIRPRSHYLVLTKDAEIFFKSKGLTVEAGVYLSPTHLISRRDDINRLVGGGLWNDPNQAGRTIVAGYAPGEVRGTRNEIWAQSEGRFFLLKSNDGADQRFARGVPREVIPGIDGAFMVTASWQLVFVGHEREGEGTVTVSGAPPLFELNYIFLTRDGDGVVYLSRDGKAVFLKKTGEHQVITPYRLERNVPQVAVSGDGVFLLEEDSTKFTFIGVERGQVLAKKVVFEKRSGEELLFRANRPIVKAVNSRGGFSYFNVSPDGMLIHATAGRRLLRATAEDLQAIMTFGENWTRTADTGAYDTIIERREYVEQLLLALSGNENTWVNLIGPYGVGKTSVLKTLARRLSDNEAGDDWRDFAVVHVPLSSFVKLQAAEDQQSKESLTKMMRALKRKKVLLFIDDFLNDSALGASNPTRSMDVFLQLFRDPIEKGEIRIVTTSNNLHWDQVITGNPSIRHMSYPVNMTEPTGEVLKRILETNLHSISADYNVSFGAGVVDVITSTARELYPQDVEPLRSIRVAKDLGIRFGGTQATSTRLISSHEARRHLLSSVFDSRSLEEINLRDFERFINARLVGQDEAKERIINQLGSLSLGVVRLEGPLGVLFFTGPTGVGKTYASELIAEYLRLSVVKVDMNFFTRFTVGDRLFQEIQSLSGRPFILLMDELDKNPNGEATLNELRAVFETGIYGQGTANELNLRNAIIIMTGNYGQNLILQNGSDSHSELMTKLRAHVLNPETDERERIPLHFWSRVEESVCIFKGLTEGELELIARKFVDTLRGDIRNSHNIEMEVSDAYVRYLVSISYQRSLGAVPIKNRIENSLRRQVAVYLSRIRQADPDRYHRITNLFVTLSASGQVVITDNTQRGFPR